MRTLEEKLCDAGSARYKERLKEIAPVLDESLTYDIKKVTTMSAIKSHIIRNSRDSGGYHVLEDSVFPLSGDVLFYPGFSIKGDFAVILSKQRMIDPVHKRIKEKNTLLVYEKAEEFHPIFGGGEPCYLTR